MPTIALTEARRSIAAGTPAAAYLIVGDDDVEMAKLAEAICGLVDDELRAFNVERLYANERGVTPATIVQAARTMPMLGDRRVVVVMRAERILKPKRRGRSDEPGDEEGEGAADPDALTQYVLNPESSTTLVLLASDVLRTTKLYKALQKNAAIIESWGLAGHEGKADPGAAAQAAREIVKKALADTGQSIDPAAMRLLVQRAGADIVTLRGDLERLLLYTSGSKRIEERDVLEVVSAETSQDNWAVTTAIRTGRTAEALRQLALSLEAGAVPYMVLGQLAWFVRERLPEIDVRRVPAAVDALFRTDLELKNSGDPRVLLERLVVELCRR